jgi:hypothetical protein
MYASARCRTMSAMPCTSVVTIGVRKAIASITTRGNDSS